MENNVPSREVLRARRAACRFYSRSATRVGRKRFVLRRQCSEMARLSSEVAQVRSDLRVRVCVGVWQSSMRCESVLGRGSKVSQATGKMALARASERLSSALHRVDKNGWCFQPQRVRCPRESRDITLAEPRAGRGARWEGDGGAQPVSSCSSLACTRLTRFGHSLLRAGEQTVLS